MKLTFIFKTSYVVLKLIIGICLVGECLLLFCKEYHCCFNILFREIFITLKMTSYKIVYNCPIFSS